MCPTSGLLRPIFIIFCLFFCCSTERQSLEDVAPLKEALVETIVQKVCNLSLDTFSNKAPEEKVSLLLKIEEKLKKSAESLSNYGDKYINLIMKGVRSKAFGTEVAKIGDIVSRNINEVDRIQKNLTNVLRTGTDNNAQQHNAPKSKEELVNNIANKIEALTKIYLSDAKTRKERQRAIEKIKHIFVESADRKHVLLHNKHDEIKTYVDLVTKGVAAMMQRNTEKNKTRRMEFVFSDNVKNDSLKNIEYYESIKGDGLYSNELGHGYPKSSKSAAFNINKSNEINKTAYCDAAVEETCNKIKLAKTFHCQSDNREVHILKLCDGVGDCLDFSDEQQCAEQAIESILSATRLINYIDTSLSHHCYPDMDKNILSKQNQNLVDVFHNQLNFLHRHELDDTAKYSIQILTQDVQAIKNTINDTVTVVDTLSSALDKTLCSTIVKDKARELDVIDTDKELEENDTVAYEESTKWTPEICKCNGQNCIKTCSQECQHTCREKFSLSQWVCSAVSGEKFVSLDMICDGKVDCYDESDENGCSGVFGFAKFEANEMYNYILQTLKTRASSVLYEKIRNQLNSLHALVQKLQKLSMKHHPDSIEVKLVRDRCFALLMETYDSSHRHIQSAIEAVEMYSFLIMLNERLVSALKRSHTGNDKLLSPDDCICRANQCALPKCSKSCIRACTAEPKLTRYFCGGSKDLNNSIPMEFICNGKKNCPDGDDERHCKDEVCRIHHLVVLRHNIRHAGESLKGTTSGEALMSWKAKVRATLMIAEKSERPRPFVLREIVADMLRDLVMSYATLDDNRRSDPGAAFKEFYSWSRVVLDALKSCGK